MSKYRNDYPIAIITPVYNRQAELIRLYNSLCSQNNYKFTWFIIDDGSTESYTDLINKWQFEAKFNIIFEKENNKGKLIAYKNAVNLLDTKWSLVIDSDDTVSKNTIDILYNTIENLSNNDCGAIFPREMKNCHYNERFWKKLPTYLNIIELRYKYNIPESALLINHNLLKYIFNNIKLPDNKFISEEIIYNEFINIGKFTVIPNLFYYGNYQDDGLTNNIFNLWKSNPESTVILLNSRYKALASLDLKNRLKSRVKTILNLNAFCLNKKLSIKKETPNIYMSVLLYIPSIFVEKARFR